MNPFGFQQEIVAASYIIIQSGAQSLLQKQFLSMYIILYL
jgi:hypothetical protein